MVKKKKNYLLGQELVRRHIVTPNQVDEALQVQKETREFVGQILLRSGSVSEATLVETLADQFKLPFIDPSDISVPKSVLELVPAKVAQHYQAFPIAFEKRKLILALIEPPDFDLMQELKTILGLEIEIVLAERQKVEEAIEKHYGIGASIVERLAKTDGRDSYVVPDIITPAVTHEMEETAGEASVRELVNQLLVDALSKRASDIHLEPFSKRLRVRYRIDGVIQEANVAEGIKRFHTSMISRIKIMANLDISERRLPQDGRIKIRMNQEELDLRISILPTAFGEALVIRLLSPAHLLKLDRIGLSDAYLNQLRQILAKPSGVVLLTGPTGSGKTTTLYACLSELNDGNRKIITVEDPVEYQLEGIIQVQVHPKIGLSFASGLRHVLRHDPDVLMVGEVRDPETAEIAVRSSLTGHLVFSTLHTNDASGAIARLLDLGVEPYLAASSLECVMAQRLVRLICAECKNHPPSSSSPRSAGGGERLGVHGCSKCHGTGFYGRTAISEFLLLDQELKNLVSRRVSTSEFRDAAVQKGMLTLRQDGLAKARAGLTTESEVLRVT